MGLEGKISSAVWWCEPHRGMSKIILPVSFFFLVLALQLEVQFSVMLRPCPISCMSLLQITKSRVAKAQWVNTTKTAVCSWPACTWTIVNLWWKLIPRGRSICSTLHVMIWVFEICCREFWMGKITGYYTAAQDPFSSKARGRDPTEQPEMKRRTM